MIPESPSTGELAGLAKGPLDKGIIEGEDWLDVILAGRVSFETGCRASEP